MHRFRKRSLLACLVAPLAFFGGEKPAAAQIDDLYQARTIVTGQGEANRRQGFAQALEQALVKVSGDPRFFGDARVAAWSEQPAELVREFGYRDRMSGIPVHDEQGTRDRPYDLTVSFDPKKIDAALRSLGREPWASPRPRVAVAIAVRHGAKNYLLAGDGEEGRDQREALAAAAARVGMPLTLPSRAALAESGLDAKTFADADDARLRAAAKTAGGDVAMAGTLIWNPDALGWVASWRLGSAGTTHRWGTSGVSFDAAFRNAMEGAAQILSGNGRPR